MCTPDLVVEDVYQRLVVVRERERLGARSLCGGVSR